MSPVSEIMDDLRDSIRSWDVNLAEDSTRRALDAGLDPATIISEGLGKGMADIGRRFYNAEIFLPQVVAASKAMDAALAILSSHLEDKVSLMRGTVVMGTVEGDIHGIGKNVCCAMLRGAGYNVIDLGIDVPAKVFADAAESNHAFVIGGSALMTTTLEGQRELVRYLRDFKLSYKCIVGGAPCTQEWCDEIGADGYSETATDMVNLVDSLNIDDRSGKRVSDFKQTEDYVLFSITR